MWGVRGFSAQGLHESQSQVEKAIEEQLAKAGIPVN
jgi:hypothetical protein